MLIPELAHPISRALQGESSDDVELVVHGPGSAEPRVLAVTMRPLVDEDGVSHGAVVVLHEITHRKEAEDERLRESEERFRLLAEQAGEAFYVLDEKGLIVDVNRSACELLAYPRLELLGMRAVDLVPEFDREAVETLLNRVETGRAMIVQAHSRRKDGTRIPLELTLSRYTIRGQQFSLAIARDMTKRLTREREIERTNALYATLSAVNWAVVRVKTREELFQEICRGTVEQAGFEVVWVGWHDAKSHAILPIASAGEHKCYLDGIRVFADDRPEGQGPGGVCFRTGKLSIFHDFMNDTRTEPWRERAIEHGICACAALPLRLAGAVRGVFIVYAGEVGVFQDREIELLEEIASSISFALDHLEQDTKRREAENALRNREAQYRAVIETSTDGFWMADEKGRVLEVNDAIVHQSGYGREELQGMHISDLEASETPDDIAIHIRKIRQQGADLFESMLRKKDGTIWPVEVNVAHWPGAGGRILAFVRDITERKRAEEAVRDSRTKLEAALASMTDAVFISDAHGRFIEFNDAFATFHRFRNKDECATTMAEYPDILEVFMADGTVAPLDMWAVPRALRGEAAKNAEYILRRKDTGETWVGSYSFAPIRDSNGVIVGSVVAGRDITEWKQAQDAIRSLNESLELTVATRTAELESMLANATIGLAYFDRDLRFCRVNRLLAEYTGAPVESFLGRTLRELNSLSADQVEPMLREIFETGQAVLGMEHDVRKFTPPHECRQVLESYFPVVDAQGKVIYVGTAVLDITDRRRAEEKLARANAELARAARLKDEFLASMSHELRTPLNGMLNIAQNLAEASLWRHHRRGRRMPRKTWQEIGQHLLSLINDILDVAKIESGNIELKLDLLRRRAGLPGNPSADQGSGTQEGNLRLPRARLFGQTNGRRSSPRQANPRKPVVQRREVHPARRQDRTRHGGRH